VEVESGGSTISILLKGGNELERARDSLVTTTEELGEVREAMIVGSKRRERRVPPFVPRIAPLILPPKVENDRAFFDKILQFDPERTTH